MEAEKMRKGYDRAFSGTPALALARIHALENPTVAGGSVPTHLTEFLPINDCSAWGVYE